jgi:SAM-dependent methyltransferase
MGYEKLVGECSGRKVLDAGCGDGRRAIEWLERGYIVTGIDISIQPEIEHQGFSYICGDIIRYASVTGKKFDVILLIDVIEHIDPSEQDQLIEDLVNCLSEEGGKLLIQTPNVGAWGWEHYFFGDSTHRFPYTIERLRRCVRKISEDLPERVTCELTNTPIESTARRTISKLFLYPVFLVSKVLLLRLQGIAMARVYTANYCGLVKRGA